MSATLRTLFTVLVTIGSAAAQTTASTDAQILTEIRNLRIDLLEDLATRQAERIEALTSDMERLQTNRTRIEQALQAQQEESRTWNQELQNASFTPDERAQMTAQKTELDHESATELIRERQKLAERHSALAARINREKERHRRLTTALHQLQQVR